MSSDPLNLAALIPAMLAEDENTATLSLLIDGTLEVEIDVRILSLRNRKNGAEQFMPAMLSHCNNSNAPVH